jgi:N-methylhydantoinase B
MSTSTAKAQAVDPVTVEIIRNGLLAVTEEMKTNLTRTAYNLIIYEALDFTVGLFTINGDTVSIGQPPGGYGWAADVHPRNVGNS